jgi:hypothetical protein
MKFRMIMSFLVLIIIFSMPMLAHAQPDPGGDPDVPIDGGLSLLVAAGVGYAAKKGYDKKKKKEAAISTEK